MTTTAAVHAALTLEDADTINDATRRIFDAALLLKIGLNVDASEIAGEEEVMTALDSLVEVVEEQARRVCATLDGAEKCTKAANSSTAAGETPAARPKPSNGA